MKEAPELYYFVQKLQKIPLSLIDFKIENEKKLEKIKIHILALAKDTLFELGLGLDNWNLFTLAKFDSLTLEENYLKICAILSYFLDDDLFKIDKTNFKKAGNLFLSKFNQHVKLIKASDFIYDDERREEFIRIVLLELDYLLKGENPTKSKDRYMSINTIEREKMLEESRKAQQRARELREAMDRKEAEEAASKYNRE